MTKTFDQGKDEVAKLCGYFATNRQPFLAPGVKEAHIRQSLIDPFFEALGWDVANKTMTAPQYREVIPEDSLDVEGEQKAPDYAFRVGTLTKFFAEAKKCGVNIDKDPAPAYQLRRYGWSAKVAVSLLTDFEELGVYDCTLRPRPSDKASHARILYFRCEEYPDRWRELWDIFSREAVWSGQFDQYAASKRKRGTSEVDVEFLKEIEAWRDALARNFALRNKDLDSDDLNRAVQLTIDRVVFLRMAEDRGLEPYQQLLKLCERPDIYSRFMRDLSRRADQKYNSGLFHFQKETGVSEDPDRVTPKLDLDDKVLKPILESLYFEHGSPYHFGVMPVEILGTVYERFLGKVIRLTPGHQAKVEEKPEVRKAGGVYYTPAYIVDYIVKHTVGKQIEGRSPAQLSGQTPTRDHPSRANPSRDSNGASTQAGVLSLPSETPATPAVPPLRSVPFTRDPERSRRGAVAPFRVPRSAGVSPASSFAGSASVPAGSSGRRDGGAPFRVLDMACGSGSFLLGAYQCLLDHCLKWYSDHQPGSHGDLSRLPRLAVGRAGERLSRRGSFPVYKDPRTGAWRLTIEEKKRILTTHIFGVDIDPQAVEVSKLSLLLKVLEGETDQSLALSQLPFGDRALPNLADNIKCGNSLIGPDYFTGSLLTADDFTSEQEYRRVNPLAWNQAFPDAMQASGFDCIIGNPPYIRMETFKEVKSYLKASYASHDERSDLYTYFIERAHRLLRSDGAFGMIVSNKFLRANYGRPLREFLKANAGVERVVDFAGLPVFQGATVRTIVLLTSRRKNTEGTLYSPPLPPATFLKVVSGSLSVDDAIVPYTYQVAPHALAESVWGFSRREADDLMVRLQGRSISLAKYCDGKICMGVKSGLTEAFVIDGDQRKAILKRNSKAGEIIKPFLNGRDVRRYHIDYNGLYLLYTYHGVRIDKYPAVERHLNPFRGGLHKRATQQAWYELQQPQYNFSQYMDRPKIIFPDIATTPRFALDDTGFYSGNTTYFIPRRDLFLLALLNSRLGYWYFKKTCAGLEGKNETYLRFFGQYLEDFPVRLLDLSKSGDKAAHDRMVTLVDSMLHLHKQLAAAKSASHKAILQRQIDSTDAEIDRLVYDLYALTPDEIAIVEQSAR